MALPLPTLTPQQYLRIERDAEYKSEYYRGEMFAMAGGSPEHSEIAACIIRALGNRLSGKGCKVYTSDLKVRTEPDGLYTYPDVTVVCGKPIRLEDDPHVIENPKVLFEVLSPSTEAKDRGFKFHQYKHIQSLAEYVLVSQTEPLVECFSRPSGSQWAHYAEARGLDRVLSLPSLGIEVPLAEIYQDVEFPQA